jgi:hypothetical protein
LAEEGHSSGIESYHEETYILQSSSSEDELAMPRRPIRKSTPAKANKKRSVEHEQTSDGAGRKARRKTLDEEIRFAAEDLHEDEVNPDDEDLRHVLESGVYSGYGTAPKDRGFLAHGGAGGPSVWMGVGYVDGVTNPERYS